MTVFEHELVRWAAGILLTVIITVWATRRYTRRSIRKDLRVYLDGAFSLFEGVAPDVRRALSVTYKDEEVEGLHHIELVVMNRGEKAISDYVEPLSLSLPYSVEVVDAAVTESEPENLDASVRTLSEEANGAKLLFDFPLLNKGDWFRVKLLLDGELDQEPLDWTLHIRAEDMDSEVPIYHGRPISADSPTRSIWKDYILLTFMMGGAAGAAVLYGFLSLIGMLFGFDIAPPHQLGESNGDFLTAAYVVVGVTSGAMTALGLTKLLRQGPPGKGPIDRIRAEKEAAG